MSAVATPRIILDLGPLLSESGGSLHLQDSVEYPGFTVGQDVFSFVAPVSFDVTVMPAGDMLVLTGTVGVPARVDCVRCLNAFDLLIESDLDVCIIRVQDDDTIPEEQERLHLPDDLRVDLWPVLVSALAGSAPYAPVHDPACLGLCPICGADRNEDPCDCEEESADSPFAVLRGVFDEESHPEDA